MEQIGIDIIDLDLHAVVNDEVAALTPYLTKGQLDRLIFLGVGDPARSARPLGRAVRFNEPVQRDAVPPGGGAPASDIGHIADHYLNPYGVVAALITSMQAAAVDTWTHPLEAAWYVSAYNDLFYEQWLSQDERFNLALVVSPLDIPLAVKEIKRAGDRPGVAAIWAPAIDKPYGQRYYWPIYELAQDLGLPCITHPVSANDFFGTPSGAGGYSSSWAERYSLLNTYAQTHLASLIFEGVFERFPRLRFLFLEHQWTWLPGLLWRMDDTYKAARHVHPWMHKAPSEYVAEHVRFGSQPALEVPRKDTPTMLELMNAATTMVFTSDYPHWDSERPTTVFTNVDDSVKQRIFHDNAAEAFGERLRVAAPAAAS